MENFEKVQEQPQEKQSEDHRKAEKAEEKDAKGLGKLIPQKTDLAPGSHKGSGFVTKSGLLFPIGFKFKGGHISSKGSVVLNKCPSCGHDQYPAQAVKGHCERFKECGFNMVSELEQYEP